MSDAKNETHKTVKTRIGLVKLGGLK